MGSPEKLRSLTRRDFLKMGGLGLLGCALPFSLPQPAQAQNENYGRVLDANLPLYDSPTSKSSVVRYAWKDLVLPITLATVGDATHPYNRVWYQFGPDGYAQSGSVQPVRIDLNDPSQAIPESGRLGEVTVPFTDSRWEASMEADIAYRIYYGTTHWVLSFQKDHGGTAWYELADDKIKKSYFVPAKHIRLVPYEELSSLSPQVPLENKRLEVHLDLQVVIAYEWDRPVYMTRAATGARFSDGNHTTDPGRYLINRKRPTRHMAAGDHAAPNSYDLPGVPWVSYFTEDGISFHGTYWHNDFGRPRSHGCVNLSIPAAKWIYRWTLPQVPATELTIFEDYGTNVDVI